MNKFTIRYLNGIKQHISKSELVILSDSLQQIGPREYLSTTTFQTSLEAGSGPNYLAGLFTIELRKKRWKERLETPRGLVERLAKTGQFTANHEPNRT